MPPIKPLDMVVEKPISEDGRRSFDLDPDLCWPVILDRIQEMIPTNDLPIELYQDFSPPEVDPRAVARDYQSRARSLPFQAWELARLARDDPRFLGPPDKVQPLLSMRKAALEMVRLWFTQALHVAIDGAPLAIRIFNRPAWRD